MRGESNVAGFTFDAWILLFFTYGWGEFPDFLPKWKTLGITNTN